jgi:hypothetical protein
MNPGKEAQSMAVTVTAFRRFGAFYADEEEETLVGYLDAAKEALEHAGVAERQRSALYDLTVYQLALLYSDKKGAVSEGGNDIPFGLQSAVHQLRNAAAEPSAT